MASIASSISASCARSHARAALDLLTAAVCFAANPSLHRGPGYDHEEALPRWSADCSPGFDVLGWSMTAATPRAPSALTACFRSSAWVRRLRLDRNQGKGAQCLRGCAPRSHKASARGADRRRPAARSCAYRPAYRRRASQSDRGDQRCAQYDESVPRCGCTAADYDRTGVAQYAVAPDCRRDVRLRLYPIAPAVALDDRAPVGRRMEFDTDVIVRLFWEGVPVVNVPTPVTYPATASRISVVARQRAHHRNALQTLRRHVAAARGCCRDD